MRAIEHYISPKKGLAKLELEWLSAASKIFAISHALFMTSVILKYIFYKPTNSAAIIALYTAAGITAVTVILTSAIIYFKKERFLNYLLALSTVTLSGIFNVVLSEIEQIVHIHNIFQLIALGVTCFLLPLRQATLIATALLIYYVSLLPAESQIFLIFGTYAFSLSANLARYHNLVRNQMIRSILEESEHPVYCTTLSGKILFANQAGKNLVMIPEVANRDHVPKAIERRLLKIKHSKSELITEHGINGKIYEIKIPHNKGNDYLVIYLTNITETRASQLALEEERLKTFDSARFKSLQVMANGVAHEINNPLAIIQGATSILKIQLENHNKDSNDKAIRMITTIIDTSERIAHTIDLLRDFSSAGEHLPYFNEHVENIIRSSLALRKNAIAASGIDLYVDLAQNSMIFCQRSKVAQAILAIIENSVEALRKGRNNRKILIATDSTQDNIMVTISDNGHGIPTRFINKVTLPFFTTRPTDQGVGLGLAIAKGNIEAQGGKLVIESIEGQGTKVIITFSKNKLQRVAV